MAGTSRLALLIRIRILHLASRAALRSVLFSNLACAIFEHSSEHIVSNALTCADVCRKAGKVFQIETYDEN